MFFKKFKKYISILCLFVLCHVFHVVSIGQSSPQLLTPRLEGIEGARESEEHPNQKILFAHQCNLLEEDMQRFHPIGLSPITYI